MPNKGHIVTCSRFGRDDFPQLTFSEQRLAVKPEEPNLPTSLIRVDVEIRIIAAIDELDHAGRPVLGLEFSARIVEPFELDVPVGAVDEVNDIQVVRRAFKKNDLRVDRLEPVVPLVSVAVVASALIIFLT